MTTTLKPDCCIVCGDPVHEAYEEEPLKPYMRIGPSGEMALCEECVDRLHNAVHHFGEECPGCDSDAADAAESE